MKSGHLKFFALLVGCVYILLVATTASATSSGDFSISDISTSPVSDCSALDGLIELTIDPTDQGIAPYDISVDNGDTWTILSQTPTGAGILNVPDQAWGTYNLAVRDASGAIIYPGYAQILGCTIDIEVFLPRTFSIATIPDATGYTWSTTIGAITSGQNTTSATIDFSSEVHNATGTICSQPTGTLCTAPPTCFDFILVGIETDCSDGIDNDGDGLVDCYDCNDCITCLDTDGDGITDFCDLDDDNDGIPDEDECPSTSSGLSGALTTFTIDVTTADATDPTETHILNSITLGGVTYSDFILPDAFESGITVDVPFRVQHKAQDVTVITMLSSSNFNADMLIPFQSRDLGSYLNLDANDYSDGDYYDLKYNTPIISTDGGFLAVTERLGNNPQIIHPLDAFGNPFGPGITISTSDYVDHNITIESSGPQNAWIALYPIEDFVVQGSRIYGLRVTFGPINNTDGPDSKVFIFGDASAVTCDADNDGIANHLDLDSDNDGIYDLIEAGHTAIDTNNDGVIDGAPATFGTNGLFDGIETSADSDIIDYSISDSETSPDGTYDAYTLDSDGDGCFDTEEENILDGDLNGVVGTGTPTTDGNGLVTTITYAVPSINTWQDPTIGPCLTELCNNGIDDDGDGLIDCNDQDCPGANTVVRVNNP